jgi:hypothetical protein
MASMGFHYWYEMELDELYNEFTKYNIKWISLLQYMEDIDSYKEASCKTSSIALTKVMWLPLLWWTYK